MTKQDIRAQINRMTPQDKSRLIQCVFCRRDPIRCGAGAQDEDKNGLCKLYLGQMLFISKEEEE